MRLQPQAAGGYRRLAHFLHRPALARLRIAMQRRRGKGVKRRVIRWMHRHQLSFKVSGQLADHQPMLRQDAADLVAVGLARRRPLDIKNRRVVAGDLQCLVPQAGGPLRYPRQVLNGARGPINCARKMPGPLIVFIPPPEKLVRLFLVVLEREKENQRDNRGGHRRDPPEGHQA